MEALNLAAFVLAQVRVDHVWFQLAVKLRRLPHLRHLDPPALWDEQRSKLA